MKRLSILLVGFLSALYAEQMPLSLQQAYELALLNNSGYKVGKYKSDAIGENVRQAESHLYPKVDLSASGGKYAYEAYYNKVSVSEDYKTYALSLTQPLYRPELLRTIDQTQTRYKAATEDLDKQSQQLGLDVAKAYFTLLQIDAEVLHLNAEKKFYEAKYHKAVDMIGYGLSNTVELLGTKVDMDKSSIDLIGKKQEFQAAKNKLERLIGQPFNSQPQYQVTYDLTPFVMSKEVWKERLSENKEGKIAQLSKKAAQDEVDIRKYEHYPKVDLSLSRSENYTNDLVAHKYDNKAFVQLSLPIYQGGYTISRVQEAALLFNAAEANVEYVNNQTLDRFEELWTQRDSLVETMKVLQTAKASAMLYYQAVKKSYLEGIKNNIDVLEAEAKLRTVESESAKSFYNLMINEISLLELTGELTVEKASEIQTIGL